MSTPHPTSANPSDPDQTRRAKLEAFDPDGPGAENGRLFGLPFNYAESAVAILPVPWDATASYGTGSARGPEAILEASPQLDLDDPDRPEAWQAGFFLLERSAEWQQRNRNLRPAVQEYLRLMAAGAPLDPKLIERVNAETEALRQWVFARTGESYAAGKVPGLLGGDHGTALGAIQAGLQRHPEMGVLQLDAHADLRVAYEGFVHSHASIMHNALESGLKTLVSVGLRDTSPGEQSRMQQDERIHAFAQRSLEAERYGGSSWSEQVERILAPLPEKVWVSFDIDALDPSLCPNTGTPVPGGLAFGEASFLLGALVHSGRRIVGFDLTEVAPHPNGKDEWDANVGARVLFRLCSLAVS
jgi:agmatinase